MGLFDQVLGAVLNNVQSDSNGGGLSSLISLAANNPQLIQVATQLLSNDGEMGGLAGLTQKFQEAGLGQILGSWVGSGVNQAITPENIQSVLGSEAVSGVASRLGVDPSQASDMLAQYLPGIVDSLTPDGQAPAQGFGNTADLMGMLGGLIKTS